MLDSPPVLAFLLERLRGGERACLVTVTDVTGASVRNPGAHMAVAEDGRLSGSLSGGCIEKAIAAEALKAIETGRPHRIAYGAGTPIIDIRLPCGGRVDLLFAPFDTPDAIDELLDRLNRRQPAVLSLASEAGMPQILDSGETGWSGDRFLVRHPPSLRLVIAGHGGAVTALVRQAGALGIACIVATPDDDVVAALSGSGAAIRPLKRVGEPTGIDFDRWTAVVVLFHDHDWELAVLAQALASPAFFIGAMGSRKTHASRLEMLRTSRTEPELLDRIVAPIGLIPSSRDPETLALSILVQVVDRYNATIGAQFNPSPA